VNHVGLSSVHLAVAAAEPVAESCRSVSFRARPVVLPEAVAARSLSTGGFTYEVEHMTADFTSRFRTVPQTALRVAAGLTYFVHGAQKILGWFGGFGPDGGTADLLSRFGAAGAIEAVVGCCMMLGIATRPLALIASGEMAVAYFWMHWGGSGHMWWWVNRGELVMLYSFIWLLFAAWGPGPFSVDAWLQRRRVARKPGPPAKA
jgi:putative oxidoreductase